VPIDEPDPTPKPEPGEPKALYSCTSDDTRFSKIEIWWVRTSPLEQIYKGDLAVCKSMPADELSIEITYPAEGTALNVDGKDVTLWMAAKVWDETSLGDKVYYQYSDFISRSRGCNQGIFRSETGEIIDLRIQEPTAGRGILTVGKTEIPLRCQNIR
jgi:hypothetical protein